MKHRCKAREKHWGELSLSHFQGSVKTRPSVELWTGIFHGSDVLSELLSYWSSEVPGITHERFSRWSVISLRTGPLWFFFTATYSKNTKPGNRCTQESLLWKWGVKANMWDYPTIATHRKPKGSRVPVHVRQWPWTLVPWSHRPDCCLPGYLLQVSGPHPDISHHLSWFIFNP